MARKKDKESALMNRIIRHGVDNHDVVIRINSGVLQGISFYRWYADMFEMNMSNDAFETAKRLLNKGMSNGVHDIMIIHDGKVGFVETKSPNDTKKRISEGQQLFADVMAKHNTPAIFANRFSEFEKWYRTFRGEGK